MGAKAKRLEIQEGEFCLRVPRKGKILEMSYCAVIMEELNNEISKTKEAAACDSGV